MHRPALAVSSVVPGLLLMAAVTHAEPLSDALPDGPLPAAVLQKLAARDGLVAEGDRDLFRLGARWITSQRRAELDGIPPAEVIVEVTEYTGEGTWQTEYRAYRPADPLPTPVVAPIITGGYRDPGYLTLVDLDGDGRDALVVVGDTDGGSPSAIDIWRLQGNGWDEQVWGPDVGLDYALFDLAADIAGQDPSTALALVALRSEGQGFVVEPWVPIDGLYRPWPIDPTPLLAPLMAHLAEHPPRRPDHVFPRLAVAVRAAGVDPGAEALRGLRRLHDQLEDGWDHATVLDAMSWTGNVAAAPHLRRFLDPPLAPDLMAAAAEGLARVGTDADRSDLLARLADDETTRDVRRAITRGFAGRGDPRARARLIVMLTDRSRSIEARATLVDVLRQDPAAVPDLARLLPAVERSLQGPIVDALWAVALFEPEHPAWKVAGVVEAIRPFVGDPDRAVARDAIAVVRAVDPDAGETLSAALSDAQPDRAVMLLAALAEIAPGAPAIPPVVAASLAALERDPDRPVHTLGLRIRHHQIVAAHGTDADRARGLAAGRIVRGDPRFIDVYIRAMEGSAPSDRAAVQVMTTALLPFSTPDRRERLRQRTAQLLGLLDDDRARAALLLLMQRDPVVYVRSAAADALARRHPDVEAALIIALVGEREDSVRAAIIGALGKHGTPRARAALIDRLGHPRDGWAAAHALARAPDAAGLEVGAVLAQRAAEVVRGAEGCEAAGGLIGALARAGLDEASVALSDAVDVCGDESSSLIAGAIDGWHREGSADSRRRVAGFADAEERAVSRAAWHALSNWGRR